MVHHLVLSRRNWRYNIASHQLGSKLASLHWCVINSWCLRKKDIDKREDHRLPPASFHAQSTYLLSCQSVSSVAQSCLTLCDPMNRSTPGLPVHHQLPDPWPPKPMSIESVMPSNHLLLCRPLLLLPSIFPSIRVFSNESALPSRWPKYWSFSFSNNPSSEYSGLISFRMDRFDLLAVHGTLKNILQHHSFKTSILQCSAFFMVQLSDPYVTTGKTVALTRLTFVVQSLYFLICCLGCSSHTLVK